MDEEGQKGPGESGAGNPAPCLIAGFHALSDISPSYWNGIRVDDAVASVDMVRLKLHLRTGGKEAIGEKAQTWQCCDEVSGWTAKVKPGAWHELLSFGIGETSVALGLGQFEPSCKLNEQRGFIEFNPNKLAGDNRFWDLLGKISPWVTRAELVRFDFAYDLPRAREACRLTKDRRMYKSVISNGITEYLGVKNTPGYVKVYDKAKEAGLQGQLTRIELTCSGEWDAGELRKHWPKVHSWQEAEGTKDWVRVVGIMLAERAEEGKEIESLIAMLGRGSRPKVREYLRSPLVVLPEDVPEAVIGEARSWCELLARMR